MQLVFGAEEDYPLCCEQWWLKENVRKVDKPAKGVMDPIQCPRLME